MRKSIEYKADRYMKTGWDAWNELVQKGYEAFGKQKDEIGEGLRFWREAWDIFQSIMNLVLEVETLYDLMEKQDYVYPIDEWLRDYEMELGNAGKYEERIAFCKKVLEIFDWQYRNDSRFRCGIGESLFGEGKIEEAYEYYENWLKDDPKNVNGIDSFIWILSENGETKKAYEVVRKATWGVSCYVDNSILFMHARQLADYIGKKDESRWYQQQLDAFQESLKRWETDEDEFFDEFTEPEQIPVVKEKKIYPNAPCPRGSGKKYKKCCGK